MRECMMGRGRAERCETARRRSLQRQQGQHCGMGKEPARVFAGPGQEDACAEKRNISTVAGTIFVASKKIKPCPFLWIKSCRTIRIRKCLTQPIGSPVIWSNLQEPNFWLVVWIKRNCTHFTNVVSSKGFICPVRSFSSSCGFIYNTVMVHFLPFSFLNNFGDQLLLSPLSPDVPYTVSLSNFQTFSEAFAFNVI